MAQFRCPVCKKHVQRNAADFPFCSSRCRVIDLGRWASGNYRIAGESVSLPEPQFSEQQHDNEPY